MNTEAQTAIVLMAVAVLLPIVPAWICFRILKSTGEVSGPLHGLKAQFGGAFAAYFAVFLCLLYIRPTDTLHFHTWEVIGTISAVPSAGEPEPNLNDIVVRAVPPSYTVNTGGPFRWTIAVAEADDGSPLFPDLQINLPNFRGQTIPLGPGGAYGTQAREIRRDDKTRQLIITTPIVLQSIAAAQAYKPRAAEQAVAIK